MATFSPEVASVAGARERLRSAADMDLERREGTAYEYLCHLGEMSTGCPVCLVPTQRLI